MSTNALPKPKQNGGGFKVTTFLTKYGLAFVVIIVIAVFGILEPRFLSTRNLLSILTSTGIIAIVGMGFTVIMSSGEIDFAIGMEFTLAGLMIYMLNHYTNLNYWITLLLTFGMLIIFALANAFLNIKIGIPAFLATMGTSLIAQYAAEGLTGGFTLHYNDLPAIFTWGQINLFGVFPLLIVIFIIVSIIMVIYTEKTKNGKKMYAVGSNPVACNYVGINFRIEKLKGFIIAALLAGFAGIMQSSQFNRVGPDSGATLLNSVLSGLMIGALFIKPGVFNIPGTIIGSFLITVIGNGLLMVSAPSYLKDFVMGTILFTSVVVITIIRRNSEKIAA